MNLVDYGYILLRRGWIMILLAVFGRWRRVRPQPTDDPRISQHPGGADGPTTHRLGPHPGCRPGA